MYDSVYTMKIFAKRKKVVDSTSAESTDAKAKIFESDKIVEELLQQKEWNARQRRMIKRYQERKATEQNDSGIDNVNDVTIVGNFPDQEEEAKQDAEDKKRATVDAVDSDDIALAVETGTKQINPDQTEDSDVKQAESEKATEVADNHATKISEDTDIDELLQLLNSKQRRLLSRRLEREGTGILEEIRREVLTLLEQKNAVEEDEKVAAESASKNKKAEKKESKTQADKVKSKKRKQPDWSSLSSDERLRREEQRRLQQEAADRKNDEAANGSHRHPLNSERRRANRRKPKWTQRKVDTPTPKTTHNASGFHIRKKQKV